MPGSSSSRMKRQAPGLQCLLLEQRNKDGDSIDVYLSCMGRQ